MVDRSTAPRARGDSTPPDSAPMSGTTDSAATASPTSSWPSGTKPRTRHTCSCADCVSSDSQFRNARASERNDRRTDGESA